MISDGFLLLFGHDLVLAFQTTHDTIDGIHEVLLADFLASAAGSNQRRLVADVRDIRSGEARRLFA